MYLVCRLLLEKKNDRVSSDPSSLLRGASVPEPCMAVVVPDVACSGPLRAERRTLSLHDALPIFTDSIEEVAVGCGRHRTACCVDRHEQKMIGLVANVTLAQDRE